MLVLKLGLLVILLLIFYQDLRFQAVSWIFFLLGFLINSVLAVKSLSFPDILLNMVIILLFIFFQLAIIYLFSWVKFKKRINIFSSVFGLGDLLFLIMILPVFSPLNFILFFIVSLVFTLLVFVALKGFNLLKIKKVPLAGLQSLFLFLVILFQIFIKFSLYNDYYILQYFVK